MNAERLLQLYDRVSDAPDAIPKLRRFILDLAVRGKLVEQDPDDEPASELLKLIALHKQELVQAGEAKAQKHVPAATRQDLSFDLPSTWEPARLADVAVCLDYMRRPINGSERAKRIEGKSGTQLYPYYGATQQQGWIDDYIFDDELVLLGEDGVPFFDPLRTKAYLISGKSWVNNHAHVFKGLLISSPFLAQYLNVFDYTGRVVGATRSKLNQARAFDIPVPLPPVAEQHRIVAKVDELMSLCDSLEAEREKREATRDRLTTASLGRLTAADVDETQFKAHADFAIQVLPELTTRPDQIKVLRQTILDLAVRGKLVEQDPNDETISEYLRRLEESEKERNNNDESPGDDSFCRLEEFGDFPFELPGGWSWMRLGSLGALASSSRVHKKDWSDAGVPFYRAREIVKLSEAGEVENELFISEQLYQSLSQKGFVPECDDIMITGVGTIGIPYVVKSADRFYFKDASVLIFKNRYGLDSQFLYWLMRSPYWVKQVHVGSMGTTVHTLTISRGKQLAVPIPPLPEQHRIVAKVDELITLCDQLERDLNSGLTNRSGLMEALLVEALEPMNMEAHA